MLVDIGVMVAAYIVTRMVSFLARSGAQAEHVLVKVLAVLTAVVAILCALDLLLRGGSSTQIPGQ